MQTILIIALVLAVLATVFMLIKGIVQFLKSNHQEVQDGVSVSGIKQNQAMQGRIAFQALAIIIAVLLILLSRG